MTMLNWRAYSDKTWKDGVWCLVKCGDNELHRFMVGRWVQGKGWKNQGNYNIFDIEKWIPLKELL